MTPRRLRRALALVGTVLGLLLAAGGQEHTAAHPLGNFTTNQYGRIEVTTEGLRVVYVLDLAEIPAFQEIQRIDTDGDGEVGDAEREAYLTVKLAEVVAGLSLTVDGQPVALDPVARELSFPEGQAGLKLLRLRVVFDVPLDPAATPDQPRRVTYRDDLAGDRIGWREVVVTHGAGIRIDGSDAPADDVSDELRAYPEDLLSSPLDRTGAAFAFASSPGAAAAVGFVGGEPSGSASDGGGVRPNGGGSGGRFAALVTGEELSALGIAGSLLAAMAWGAAHALSPGHGKTVVGAYLIGARGTARHALFLGATVTVTHTAGVVALGLVTLFASRYVVPERLYPWMSLVSGLLVVGMGLLVLRQRVLGRPALGHSHAGGQGHDHIQDHRHGHSHGDDRAHGGHTHTHGGRAHSHGGHTHSHGGRSHSHLPPGAAGTPVTWRSLTALGVSGGLIPCPSALVVLLGSIALGRVGFGLVLVVAFSVGLAGTLTGVGLLFLHAGRLLERRMRPGTRFGTLLRYGPIAGAGALTLAGVAIVVRALSEMRVG